MGEFYRSHDYSRLEWHSKEISFLERLNKSLENFREAIRTDILSTFKDFNEDRKILADYKEIIKHKKDKLSGEQISSLLDAHLGLGKQVGELQLQYEYAWDKVYFRNVSIPPDVIKKIPKSERLFEIINTFKNPQVSRDNYYKNPFKLLIAINEAESILKDLLFRIKREKRLK